MSGVGSVGTSDSNSSLLYLLYLQSAGLTGAAAGSAAGSSTSNNSVTADPTSATSAGTSTSSTPSNLSDLRSQLETAITNAINNVSDPNNPTDVLGAVHNAIDTTLEANGISPQQAHRHGGSHGHHHAKVDADSSNDSTASDSTASDPTTVNPNLDSTNDGGSDGLAGVSGSNSSQDLLAILLSIGNQASATAGAANTSATNQSSQPNSLASILAASGGVGTGSGLDLNTLFGQLFASFPPGSGLNVTA